MGKKKSGPFSGQRIDPTSSKRHNFPTYFLIHRISSSNETFHNVSPFLVEKGITSSVGEVKSTKKLRSGDLLVEVESPKQAKQIVKLNALSSIPVTVNTHATLNSSKGVISCGELLNESVEKITEELNIQGVTHVRRITIRRDGQLLNTKHLILTFDSAKLPEHIKAGYMRLSVRTYIPNPLRCFKCQRFGHSKTSCRGTLTCARCAEVGHESTNCTRTEKCVNCKGEHTSFSRNCSAWKQEREIISTKIKKQISYQEARKLIKSQTPSPGNSYVCAVKKSFSAPSVQTNPDASAVTCSKPSDSTAKASPITNLPIPPSPSVAPVSEEALASPDLTDFKLVTNRKKLKKDSPTKTNNSIAKAEKISRFYTSSRHEVLNTVPTKDNICTHQSALKPFETKKPTSVDTQLLPMAVLPPLEQTVLQSRESDADAEMSSSLSEEDALEYDMSEDLEDSPAVTSPPSSKPEKANRIWREHVFPAKWKYATVIPIPKPGKDPQNPLNYRPIALTSCMCRDMRFVERQLQTAVNNMVTWSNHNGFTFSTQKTSGVHFCRRLLHPDPELFIQDTPLTLKDVCKFLGVVFDRRLTFVPHIAYLRKTCLKSLNVLKTLSNTSWGADRACLLRAYRSVILSKLDNGCAAYGSTRPSYLA
ncbi:hypothetical protein AVEN_21781-1 [Araneus ventricosus]|uniref:CCHC-type domain-containing protein n=1 Tax=Araneus ventricosus TaxID=182803 RepID=A0A4Y2NKD0_ARAVE|nr:hypothetical protein AVEN_21781-1 [Araneus ventricosus]